MRLSIHTIRKTVYSGETDRLTAPTVMGEVTILPHHESYVTLLTKGDLKFTKKHQEGPHTLFKEERFAVKGGFLEVRPDNEIRVLADE